METSQLDTLPRDDTNLGCTRKSKDSQRHSAEFKELSCYFACKYHEVYFRSIAINSIDKWNTHISRVVQQEVRIPLSVFEYISKGNLTRGSLIASNFNFATLDDIDEFFSKALRIKCLETLREFDRLDPSNYFHYAASLNRNWKSFMQMFDLIQALIQANAPSLVTSDLILPRNLCAS